MADPEILAGPPLCSSRAYHLPTPAGSVANPETHSTVVRFQPQG